MSEFNEKYESEGDRIEKNHNKAVIAFGRFQPPTIGHGSMIKQVSDKAAINERFDPDDPDSGGISDAYIFVSTREYTGKKSELDKNGNPENPLNVNEKIYWLKRMFAYTNVKFIDTKKCKDNKDDRSLDITCRDPYKAINELVSRGYTYITFFAGSDRLDNYSKMASEIMRYSGIKIKVVSAGVRHDTTDIGNISGISGTKMRKYAKDHDYNKFKEGFNLSNEDSRILMEILQQKMRIPEGKQDSPTKKTTRKRKLKSPTPRSNSRTSKSPTPRSNSRTSKLPTPKPNSTSLKSSTPKYNSRTSKQPSKLRKTTKTIKSKNA
jgi:hypothetical protein